MKRRYALLNVFTSEPQGGNPLAVVTDAEGLNSTAMQSIARKLNYSETVFVFPPKNPAHTASIRIFTPAAEVPFAGHPTVGTAIFLAYERVWRKAGAEFDALVVLEVKAGTLRVAVKPGSTAFAEFDALQLPQEPSEAAPNDRLAAALGLAPTEIGFENFRPLRLSAGVPFTFVPVKDLNAMGRARVVDQFWRDAFADELGAAYLYCRETVRHKTAFHARAFAPLVGIPEDPATGAAAAAFAGIINLFDGPPEGTYSCKIEQGIEMGRPSEIFLEMEITGRQIRAVRIGGHALLVSEDMVTP
jgi:trans-2,3-dihydro-3-hydroxyanthranilate isomerase